MMPAEYVEVFGVILLVVVFVICSVFFDEEE